MKEKKQYQHMRITKELNKRIKILAAINGTTMIEILQILVTEAENTNN